MLSGAEEGAAVPGVGSGVPRPVGAGAAHPTVGAAAGKPGPQGHPRTQGRCLSGGGGFYNKLSKWWGASCVVRSQILRGKAGLCVLGFTQFFQHFSGAQSSGDTTLEVKRQ